MKTTAVFTFSFPDTKIPYSFEVSAPTEEEAKKLLTEVLQETIEKLQAE